MEPLLFEKIAFLEKLAKKPKIPTGATAEEAAAIKAGRKAEKAAKKRNSEAAHFFTFPDGTKVDKRRYPGFDWNNIASTGQFPTDNYLYRNPRTPSEVRHNTYVHARNGEYPSTAWDKVTDMYHQHKINKLNDEIDARYREARNIRHVGDMRRTYKDIAEIKADSADELKRTNMYGVGLLGAGGVVGGGAMLSAQNAAQPMMYSTPSYYEQDYYH